MGTPSERKHQGPVSGRIQTPKDFSEQQLFIPFNIRPQNRNSYLEKETYF